MTGNERRKKNRRNKEELRRKNKRDLKVGFADDMSRVYDLDNLYYAYKRCRRNVKWKGTVQKYSYDYAENLIKASDMLKSGELISFGFQSFTLNERGVEREILSNIIDERVPQCCLCEFALIPVVYRSIVYSNGASVKGKGITYSEDLMKKNLKDMYKRTDGNKFYMVLIDIKSYFKTINRKNVEGIIDNLFEDKQVVETFRFFCEEFEPHFPDGVGMGLGSQVSQISGIIALNGPDHYAIEVMGYGNMQRYMDDIAIPVTTEEEGLKVLDVLEERIKKDGLTLNRRKCKVVPVSEPFIWLKKHFFIDKKGNVKAIPVNETFKRERRRLRTAKSFTEEGKYTLKQFNDQFRSWYGQTRRYDCKDKLYQMERYFEKIFFDLWEEEKCVDVRKLKKYINAHPKTYIFTVGNKYMVFGKNAISLSEKLGIKTRTLNNGTNLLSMRDTKTHRSRIRIALQEMKVRFEFIKYQKYEVQREVSFNLKTKETTVRFLEEV